MSFDKIIYRLTDKRIPAVTGIGLVGDILERAGFQNRFSNIESVGKRSKKQIDTGAVMTTFIGLEIPEDLRKWSWDAKSILFTIDDAVAAAERNGVEIHYVTGNKGTIGAVAAIGCFDLGLMAAGIPEDFE